jgi:hypothetical protein
MVMTSRVVTLIDESRPVTVDAVVHDGTIRLAPPVLERALGWELKPEGLCLADTCVPVRDRAALVGDDGVDLRAFARLIDRPLAMDPDEGIAVLGASAGDRSRRLAAMDAPDFTLPDLEGRLHSLRDQRGKKTLLIAWASW